MIEDLEVTDLSETSTQMTGFSCPRDHGHSTYIEIDRDVVYCRDCDELWRELELRERLLK